MQAHRRIAALLAGACLLFGFPSWADSGTIDLDAVDTGGTEDLDDADTGSTESLDDVDTGSTVSLDDAETVQGPLPLPAAVPDIEDDDARATAKRARAELDTARQRLERANAAYSEMRARDHPRGDARGAIVQERDTARRTYDQANARYAEILEQ